MYLLERRPLIRTWRLTEYVRRAVGPILVPIVGVGTVAGDRTQRSGSDVGYG